MSFRDERAALLVKAAQKTKEGLHKESADLIAEADAMLLRVVTEVEAAGGTSTMGRSKSKKSASVEKTMERVAKARKDAEVKAIAKGKDPARAKVQEVEKPAVDPVVAARRMVGATANGLTSGELREMVLETVKAAAKPIPINEIAVKIEETHGVHVTPYKVWLVAKGTRSGMAAEHEAPYLVTLAQG